MSQKQADDIRQSVRDSYAKVAEASDAGAEPEALEADLGARLAYLLHVLPFEVGGGGADFVEAVGGLHGDREDRKGGSPCHLEHGQDVLVLEARLGGPDEGGVVLAPKRGRE